MSSFIPAPSKQHIPDLLASPVICPICDYSGTSYLFNVNGNDVWGCPSCETLFLHPQPSDEKLAEIYQADYFLGGDSDEARRQRLEMKSATARLFLGQLVGYRGEHSGSLLDIGCGQGELLVEAEQLGYDVTGIEVSAHAVGVAQTRLQRGRVLVGTLESAGLEPASFDVVISTDVIEHARSPRLFLEQVHRLLKPSGVLILVTISLDTWTARLLKHNWMEFKTEHLVYFSNNSLQSLMYLTGFDHVRLEPAYKILSPKYVLDHFVRYPVPLITSILQVGYRLLPGGLQKRALRLTGSGVAVMAKASNLPARRKLSIVLPVYNEAATFGTVMERLLALDLNGLDKEIILIESNSSDGTREQVLRYQGHPQVKVILQDRPRGKGFAVRAGFEQATGDFVLIQDADLEYDVKDYPALLSPLCAGRRTFVLGSRHSGHWNMRKFEKHPLAAAVLNIGHIVFCTLLNLMYGQHLRDPFTMYKVFLRDCLDGLQFESNRFDFDYELVIKLLRKGYIPIEIPVSYRSRSFKEGKKVSFIRDPLTWIRALVKFRFSPLYKKDTGLQ